MFKTSDIQQMRATTTNHQGRLKQIFRLSISTDVGVKFQVRRFCFLYHFQCVKFFRVHPVLYNLRRTFLFVFRAGHVTSNIVWTARDV
jgi:hypothetical protein